MKIYALLKGFIDRTLEFCGIKPVRVLRLDRIRFRLPAQEEQLLARVRQLTQN
jgi:hypothetical protein